MKKVTEIVAELARPVVEEHGCTLWDVEYVREAGQWYLRLLIDKQGGVDILDCEAISRVVSDLLDEADPIEGSYVFEVRLRGSASARSSVPRTLNSSWARTCCSRPTSRATGARSFPACSRAMTTAR